MHRAPQLRLAAFNGPTEDDRGGIRNAAPERLSAAELKAVYGPAHVDGWAPGEGSYVLAQFRSLLAAESQARTGANGAVSSIINFKPDRSVLPLETPQIALFERVQRDLRDNGVDPRKLARGMTVDELLDQYAVNAVDFREALALTVRNTILRKIRDELQPVTAALALKNPAQDLPAERRNGRYVVPGTLSAFPEIVPGAMLDFGGLAYEAGHTARASDANRVEIQAAQLSHYLVHLTRSHTSDAHLTPQFLDGVRDKLTGLLRRDEPLCFSLYLSLEKFPHPLDTRDSQVDVGELLVAQELRHLIETVEKITGRRPNVVIINESAATGNFTRGSTADYEAGFCRLLGECGIAEQVRIVPLDHDYFVRYLVDRGVPAGDARPQFETNLALLKAAYEGVHTHAIQSPTAEGVQAFYAERFADVPAPVRNAAAAFVAKHFKGIERDISFTIKSERGHSVDTSLFLPRMNEGLLRNAIEASGTRIDPPTRAESGLNRMMVHQAVLQGLEFRALMRMRYMVQEQFGVPLLPPHVVALSMTYAEDKLCIPLGRRRNSEVFIDDVQVTGVKTQHGTGVVANGRTASVEWHTVLAHPSRFHEAKFQVGSTVVPGIVFTMRGALCDLDGTLKASGKPIEDEVFRTVYLALSNNIPFGFATARGQESIGKLILNGMVRYMERNALSLTADQERLLYVSGNNGAIATVGVRDPRVIHSTPFDSRIMYGLPAETAFARVFGAYLGRPGSVPEYRPGDEAAWDDHALYLEPGRIQEALRALDVQPASLNTLADIFNREFVAWGVPARAHANSEGVDIVAAGCDKGVARHQYRELLSAAVGREVRDYEIARIGDTPEGNDAELVEGLGGRVDITGLGPSAVAQYLRLMLNLAEPKRLAD